MDDKDKDEGDKEAVSGTTKSTLGGASRALWPVAPWVGQSLEPCLALSLVPQSAQRKSG
jgi:hypothetical protein